MSECWRFYAVLMGKTSLDLFSELDRDILIYKQTYIFLLKVIFTYMHIYMYISVIGLGLQEARFHTLN